MAAVRRLNASQMADVMLPTDQECCGIESGEELKTEWW